MRATRLFGKGVGPRAPIPVSGRKDFDSLFPEPKSPKKAWHGQDKDTFFREKYAHVHAKQLQRRQKEQAEAASRRKSKPDAINLKPQPVSSFGQKIREQLARDNRLEHVYGTSVVKAVLHTRNVLEVWSGHSLDEVDQEIRELCLGASIPLHTNTPLQHLNILSDNGVHNKYVAAVHKREIPQAVAIPAEEGRIFFPDDIEIISRRRWPLALYLDQITDSHNMGALLRSACWFGVDFVAVSSRNSAPLSPTVLKASAGAAEFVPIVNVPHPLRLLDNLKEQGWAITASLPRPSSGLTAIVPTELGQLDQPLMLVVGSEGSGIRRTIVQRSTHSVTLHGNAPPQSGLDSLNVSVATALFLSYVNLSAPVKAAELTSN